MKKVFVFAMLWMVSFTVQAQTEEELITATLLDYIEGTANGQPERIAKAFHPDLNLYAIRDGALAIRSGKEYIEFFTDGRKRDRIGKILMIDYENDAAMAKVEIGNSKNTTPYIDYFMLLKLNGKWTVIHKMYTKREASN
ncbi:MAG: nuclear transport factor 2 family protein [Bacteroidota bacterium]